MAMSRSLDGRSLTIRSPMTISPEVISSRPATMRSVVVLPQPDGPTRTMNSLSRIVRLTSLTACTSSYFLLSPLSTTCAMSDLAVQLDWPVRAYSFFLTACEGGAWRSQDLDHSACLSRQLATTAD